VDSHRLPANRRDPQMGQIRVLIVDQSPLVRDQVRLACEDSPDLLVVAEAEDATGAIEACRDLRPNVMVFDPFMGGTEGLQLVRRLRAEGMPIRSLAITNRSDPAWLFEAWRLDVGGVVPKTPLPRDLAQAIQTVAREGRLFPEGTGLRVLSHLGDLVRQARERSRVVGELSNRQIEVLRLLGGGLTTRQMASRLGISERTVEAHVSKLYGKLGVRTRVEAVGRGISLGLIDIGSE
jgi:DNA-binding NarL/FixJ family response regulator